MYNMAPWNVCSDVLGSFTHRTLQSKSLSVSGEGHGGHGGHGICASSVVDVSQQAVVMHVNLFFFQRLFHCALHWTVGETGSWVVFGRMDHVNPAAADTETHERLHAGEHVYGVSI